jgi:hypothetical protein
LDGFDIFAIYHFLFETYVGIGCLIGVFLVASVIAAFIMERRTRKRFVDRGESTSRIWEFGGDEDDKGEQ